jgi:hypothetical protein
MKSGRQLMVESRMHCLSVAEGDFTPIVIERYGPLFGGEIGFTVGYPSKTVTGHGCIIWDHHPSTGADDHV